MDMKINAKPVTKPAECTSPQKEPDRLQKLLWMRLWLGAGGERRSAQNDTEAQYGISNDVVHDDVS